MKKRIFRFESTCSPLERFSWEPKWSVEVPAKIRAVLSIFFLILGLGLVGTARTETLPQGNTGIAARYPSDAGIASDPAVIFTDDFESYSSAAGLTSRWNQAWNTANMRIASESGNFFSGNKALEMTIPRQSSEAGNVAAKSVSPKRDVLFLRYYSKFDVGFNVLGSSHNGSTIEANYCCPGVRADGYNKFFVSYEAVRGETAIPTPGKLGIYIYYPDQRDVWGDHFFPTGVVSPFTNLPFDFGPEFVPHPDVVPELGHWHSYELMVKANTPGQRNGRIAMWLDGNLIADFPNLRLRETTDLAIDKFTIGLHVKSNTLAVAKKWYDNVVAATSYIGPMVSSGSSYPLQAPTGLRVVP